MSSDLAAYRNRCALAIENTLEEADACVGENLPRSKIEEWTASHEGDQCEALIELDAYRWKFAGLQYQHLCDAVESTTVLLRADSYNSVWADGALARTAFESASVCCELMAPDDPAAVRLLKTATLGIEGRSQEIQLYEARGSSGRAEKQRDAIRALALRCGLTPWMSRRGDKEIGLQFGGLRVLYHWRMTDLVNRWMADVPEPYRASSPAVHAGWWYLGGAFDAAPHPELRGVNAGGAILTAIFEMEACRAVAAALSGADSEAHRRLQERINFRRVALRERWQAVKHHLAQADLHVEAAERVTSVLRSIWPS